MMMVTLTVDFGPAGQPRFEKKGTVPEKSTVLDVLSSQLPTTTYPKYRMEHFVEGIDGVENDFARDRGWRFKLVTERHIRTALLDNARFLRRYRALPEQDLYVQQLLYTLRALGKTTPQALLAAAYWAEESRMAALPMLWKLIATGRLGADLQVPLTMSASIWPPGNCT